MRPKALLLIALVVFIVFPGCYKHTHTLGGGPHTGVTEEHIQWWLVWGFMPIGIEVDGGEIAGTSNCRITTKVDPVGVLVNIVTAGFVGRRVVTVEK